MNYAHIYRRRSENIIPLILLSLFFHFIVISIALFFSSQLSSYNIHRKYTFYEVNLVELPRKIPKRKKKKEILTKKNKKNKIISRKKVKSIVIAKKRIRIHKKRRKDADKIIEEAISKIKKRQKRKGKDYIEEAINRIKKSIIKEEPKRKGFSTSSGIIQGLSLRLYKEQIKDRIKSNWVYPMAFIGAEKKRLKAIMILKVKKDGEIIKFWFKKKSNDAIFNHSLIKAIKRSNPLPPFPEGYKKRYEEIEIYFNLSELMGS